MKTKSRKLRCCVEGCQMPATHLCDCKLAGARLGLTCDAPMCPRHAKLIRFGVHHCPDHADSV